MYPLIYHSTATHNAYFMILKTKIFLDFFTDTIISLDNSFDICFYKKLASYSFRPYNNFNHNTGGYAKFDLLSDTADSF